MIALPLAALLALAAPAPATCADLPENSTIADQFTCYKNAGRKIIVPGTGFTDGFDGAGCIAGVWADRIQVATCGGSSFNRRTVMVMFASIRSVEDEQSLPYVVLRLVGEVTQVDCAVVNCINSTQVEVPPPVVRPRPAQRPLGTAAPRKP